MSTVTRYELLVQLWQHHNSTQLQWPGIVLAAALAVAALVVHDLSVYKPDCHPTQVPEVILLVISGFGVLIIAHVMARARRIMSLIECELSSLEDQNTVADLRFDRLCHPEGVHGARLLRGFMVVVGALLLTGAGALINLVYFGPIGLILAIFTWQFLSRFKRK